MIACRSTNIHPRSITFKYLPRFAREDLAEALIQPAALDAAEVLAEATAANSARVAKYLARYKKVQDKRMAMQVRLPGSGLCT